MTIDAFPSLSGSDVWGDSLNKAVESRDGVRAYDSTVTYPRGATVSFGGYVWRNNGTGTISAGTTPGSDGTASVQASLANGTGALSSPPISAASSLFGTQFTASSSFMLTQVALWVWVSATFTAGTIHTVRARLTEVSELPVQKPYDFTITVDGSAPPTVNGFNATGSVSPAIPIIAGRSYRLTFTTATWDGGSGNSMSTWTRANSSAGAGTATNVSSVSGYLLDMSFLNNASSLSGVTGFPSETVGGNIIPFQLTGRAGSWTPVAVSLPVHPRHAHRDLSRVDHDHVTATQTTTLPSGATDLSSIGGFLTVTNDQRRHGQWIINAPGSGGLAIALAAPAAVGPSSVLNGAIQEVIVNTPDAARAVTFTGGIGVRTATSTAGGGVIARLAAVSAATGWTVQAFPF